MPLDAGMSLPSAPLHTGGERERLRRAKLIFAAAEDARRLGRTDEHRELLARWRAMLKGHGAS